MENLKIDAAVKEDFNLIDAFSLLDVNGRGYITPTDLRQALSELGIKCNIDEVELIFERFATSKGKEASILMYSDFQELMTPLDNNFARLLGGKRI